MRRELAWWMALVAGGLGTAFPHLYASRFLDDHKIVRMIAVPVLLVAAVILSDHYIF